MTETLLEPPPPPPPPPPAGERRLERDPQDRVVGGVCAALARYTDTDPVLWRVAVAVLAVFGGAGLALYAFGWLLLPSVGDPQSPAERVLRRPDRTVRVLGVVALVVLAMVVLGITDDGAVLAGLVVLGGLAWLVARERREPRPVVAGPPLPPPPPRERSPLGGLTVSAAAVVAGVLLAARAAGADGVDAPRVLAAVLLVLGAGLLVGTWWGRARWLLPLGLVVAVLLAGSAVADRAGVGGDLGERRWEAVDGGEYRLAVGEAVLDLRDLRGAEDARVSARVGAGELVVLVPRGTSVGISARLGLGALEAPGIGPAEGPGVSQYFVVGSADDVTVVLDLEVGLGELEVRRVAA